MKRQRRAVGRELPSGASCSNPKRARLDLGLAILSAVAVPGVCYDNREIAAYANCSRQRIDQIFQGALRKIHLTLKRDDPEQFAEWEEAIASVVGRDRTRGVATLKRGNLS